MAHSEKCPVCNGKGKVKKEQCHGCLGLGWVTVQDQLIIKETECAVVVDGHSIADAIIEQYNNGHQGLRSIWQ